MPTLEETLRTGKETKQKTLHKALNAHEMAQNSAKPQNIVQKAGEIVEISPNAPKIATIGPKAAFVRYLTGKIPLNEYALPEYIFRADLLPPDLHDEERYDPQIRAEYLQIATVELDYAQGFPTMPDGEAFWLQFPHESPQAYKAFHAYLELPRDLADRTAPFPDDPTSRPHRPGAKEPMPVRQLHELSRTLGIPTIELQEYFFMYFWQFRTRAHDMFIVARHKQLKESRLMQLEDDHYIRATQFVDAATIKLTEMMNDPEADIRAKDMIDLLTKMMQFQRLAVGVPGNTTPTQPKDAPPAHASMEVILRNLASGNAQQNRPGDEGGDVTDDLAVLFDNPDDLAQAQELIVRMNTNQAKPRTGVKHPNHGKGARVPIIDNEP